MSYQYKVGGQTVQLALAKTPTSRDGETWWRASFGSSRLNVVEAVKAADARAGASEAASPANTPAE